jgi:hypothetical protein
MKTTCPRLRIGGAMGFRAGEGAYCQNAGNKAIRQRAEFVDVDRKGLVNRAGCRP